MAKKIYLSAAAHATDNKTKCPVACSENTHCNQYMDNLEKRLLEVGFAVRRGNKALTGSQAMTTRVAEANQWKSDIYYVAHTNAGGGRYSMTMCYTDKASKAKADVFHKYRKCITHKVKQTNSLYEINATAMPCLYDELFFHDNETDCRWFHNGGMEQLLEETLQELFIIKNHLQIKRAMKLIMLLIILRVVHHLMLVISVPLSLFVMTIAASSIKTIVRLRL